MARFKMKPKVGIHSAIINGTRVTLRPGDEVECDKHALGDFLYKFDVLDSGPEADAPDIETKHLQLQAKGGGWFDVINERSGRAINDRPLRKKDALELLDNETRKAAETEDNKEVNEDGDGQGDGSPAAGKAEGVEA